jgi:hypothetical protein
MGFGDAPVVIGILMILSWYSSQSLLKLFLEVEYGCIGYELLPLRKSDRGL